MACAAEKPWRLDEAAQPDKFGGARLVLSCVYGVSVAVNDCGSRVPNDASARFHHARHVRHPAFNGGYVIDVALHPTGTKG
jgi:hypothetical protein